MSSQFLQPSRLKQVLQPRNLNTETSELNTRRRKDISNNLNDILVVSKIPQPESEELEKEIDEDIIAAYNSLLEEELKEQNQVFKENENIAKKQLQVLQADERGRQAINAEIAEIKNRQEKRTATLKARKKAIEVEKARSKKIALLPPPLPKSIRLLLKKQEMEMAASANTQENSNMKQQSEDIENNFEEKENVIDEIELQALQKLKEARDIKAQKRFNEALKKDRQQQEYAEILKNIEEAERINRRQMAKNVSSEKGKRVPCLLSDRFQNLERQTDMENAVESVYKKNSTKEHAIEDLEGYEDIWEKKYDHINSDQEEKLIDCIPSFVKENYEYLLQDESEYQGGNRFSGLNDSSTNLNVAFLQSPPISDLKENNGENIETIINRLDEMRAELQTTYEETLKPMIEAELEAPKKQLADKAVIADILKLPDEDKAVGTDSMLQSPPPMDYDYMNGGLMAFKRRDIGSIFNYYRGMDSHPTFPKEVRSSPELNRNNSMFGTWSSSSYWSLPSKYGMPNLSHMCDEQSCDICNAEKYTQSSQACSSSDKIMIKETTNGLSSKPSHREDIAASPKKSSSFSTYVQQLVDKYLPAETKSSVSQPSDLQKDFAVLDQGSHVAQSENDNVSSHIPHRAGTPFSRMISEKAPDGIKYPSEENKSNSISNGKSHFELSSAKSIENNQNQLTTRAKLKELDENKKFKTAHVSSPESESRRQLDFRDVSNFNNTDNNHSLLLLHGSKSSLGEKKSDIQSGVEIQKPKISSSLNSIESKQSDIVVDSKLKTSNQEEPYNASLILSPESELKRQEIIRQLVFKNFKVNNNSNNQQSLSKSKSGALYSERELLPEEKNESPHVYHELSTIQEMDSAITAGSSQFSYSESYIEQKSPKRLEAKRKNSLEKSSESTDDIDTISLLDAPPSEVSELAKNIHFIPDASVKTAKYDLAKEDSKSSRKLSGAEEESNKLLIDVKTDENSSELTTLSPSLLSSNKASSSLVGSTDSPSFISHRESTPCFRPQKSLPEYFKDVSKIQHGELSPSERLLPSSSVSLSSSSVALSDVGINNKRERKVTENPEIEYNAPNHLYSTANKFQSLSSCSDISTPDVKKYENEVNKRNQYVNMYDEENAGSLDLNSVADKMTPRPFLQNTDNSRSFYPLRSCSKISTPESIDEQVTCLPRSYTRARSGGSFKPMSFTSDISTPAETVISKGSNSSDTSNSVNFMPMTLCFDISTPGSVKSKSSNSMTSNYVSIPQPHLQPANISKISCYVTLNSKSPLSKSEISHQSQNIHLQEMHPTRVLGNLPAFQSKLPNATSQTVMHIPGKNSYERARACTSGFFIPQILASDFSPPKSICSEIIEGTLYSTESLESVPAQNENICPSLLVSHGGGDCVKIPTIAVSTDCEKSDSKNQDDPNIKRFCSEDKSRTTIESNKASEECEQFNNADDAPVSHQEKDLGQIIQAVSALYKKHSETKENTSKRHQETFDILTKLGTTVNQCEKLLSVYSHEAEKSVRNDNAFLKSLSGVMDMDEDPGAGIIPRSLHQLFEELNKEENVEYSVRVSFLELYNEELFDLLSSTELSRLRLFEDSAKKGSVIIQGLGEIMVNSKDEVYAILEKGTARRQTGATVLNATSSRSHTVFSVTVHIKENTIDGEELLKTGKLNLVDLAGSENVGRSGAVDKRAREAGNINQSLLTLGRVITALIEKQPHVPYRESKLTRLLQDSLGGHTKTSIIATVSPALCNIDETLSTLDYATKAKSITIKPEVNQKTTKRALIKEYTEEIERLRKDLVAQRSKEGIYVDSENYNNLMSDIERKTERIKELSDKLDTLKEENAAIEQLFATMREELLKRTQELEETVKKYEKTASELTQNTDRLNITKKILSECTLQRDEKEYIVNVQNNTEKKLTRQAQVLLSVADTTADDVSKLHAKIDRKHLVEKRNEEKLQNFQSTHQKRFVKLDEIVANTENDQVENLHFLSKELESLKSGLKDQQLQTNSFLDDIVHCCTSSMLKLLPIIKSEAEQQIEMENSLCLSIENKMLESQEKQDSFMNEKLPTRVSQINTVNSAVIDWILLVHKQLQDKVERQKNILNQRANEQITSFNTIKDSIKLFHQQEKEALDKCKEMSSETSIEQVDLHKKSCATNPFLTAGSLKNTPSCSSDEKFSDCFSGSMITYQSTPIKTVEEIIQETGILEEPDLTLVNTMFSCGSILEEPRYHSELVSLKENLDHTLEDIEDTLPQKKSVTPNYSARIQATYVDSPSMISFLQHEMSCLAPKNDPCITENKTEGKKEKVREEYKKRTKRLWNNLEEVKKKNLIEEQKKRLVMNRLKVKEFSKKLSTPKKKNNK